MSHVARAKLLSSVSGVECYRHVRGNPSHDYLHLRSALYDAVTVSDTEAVKATGQLKSKASEEFGAMYSDRLLKVSRWK